jgi:hypothetical protein
MLKEAHDLLQFVIDVYLGVKQESTFDEDEVRRNFSNFGQVYFALAFNFPGIMVTFGPSIWEKMKPIFVDLTKDLHFNVSLFL